MTFARSFQPCTCILLLLFAAVSTSCHSAHAQSRFALEGTVRSKQESAMAGVLVSAKRDGSSITTTVVTDSSGHFQFPRDRLSRGTYHLAIRATGYELSSPATAVVDETGTSSANLNLRP